MIKSAKLLSKSTSCFKRHQACLFDFSNPATHFLRMTMNDISELISSIVVMPGPPLEPGQWPTLGPDLRFKAAHPLQWPGCAGSVWGSWYIKPVLLSCLVLWDRDPAVSLTGWSVLCLCVCQSVYTLIFFAQNTASFTSSLLLCLCSFCSIAATFWHLIFHDVGLDRW